ncbi:hypothetical protein EVJ58_g8494 [Rhodofomes roseus]|uniref:HAT C-terminal dimerisation domain-containing protein n=1 Tax=Rhodofomes roseus TaxID=34475 RepID=A0A4Y9Y2D8_9APHY|nr:hypothetical protein EVJ58_g8494 [Rhodofomes roseus]
MTRVVDVPEFRDLMMLMRPDMKQEDIPHCTKMMSLVQAAFEEHYKELKVELKGAVGNISFTADVWDSSKRQAFLAITAHWVVQVPGPEGTSVLVMKSALLVFKRIKGRHQGETLGQVLFKVLKHTDILAHIGKFTTNGGSNNKTMLAKLKKELLECYPNMDWTAEDIVFCLSHIVNRCSLKVIDLIAATPPDHINIDEDNNNDEYDDEGEEVNIDNEGKEGDEYNNDKGDGNPFPADDDADNDDEPGDEPGGGAPGPVPDDGTGHTIKLVRRTVRAIQVSPQRKDAWEACIWLVNSRDGTALSELHLILDVRTHWDSTYAMIKRFILMHQVYTYFRILPGQGDFAASIPNLLEEDWHKLEAILVVLSVPHKIQMCLSGSSMPLLAEVVPLFELFMQDWEQQARMKPQYRRAIKGGLKLAAKHYKKMDDTDAYVLAMFVHPLYRLEHIREHWDKDYIQDSEELIKSTMRKYKVKYFPDDVEAPAPPVQPRRQQHPSMQRVYNEVQGLHIYNTGRHVGAAATPGQREVNSMDREYAEWVAKGREPEHEDVLLYWSNPNVKKQWPILWRIAMDYLPIQATSVPWERLFSSSANMDTPKRNHIGPQLMEALQVLKYLIKRNRLSFMRHLQSLSNLVDNLLAEKEEVLSVHADLAVDDIFSII